MRLDLRAARGRLGDALNARDEERPAVEKLAESEALLALGDEMVLTVGRRHVTDQASAAVPMRCRSMGAGSSTFASRCITMPT